jgi:hypothetical protein
MVDDLAWAAASSAARSSAAVCTTVAGRGTILP